MRLGATATAVEPGATAINGFHVPPRHQKHFEEWDNKGTTSEDLIRNVRRTVGGSE